MAGGAYKPHPLIIWNGKMCFLVVEKEVICHIIPVAEAAVALLGAYYVFNIKYPKSFALVGTFYTLFFKMLYLGRCLPKYP